MNILIVDDESLARDRIKRQLMNQPDYKIVGEACNGFEALEKANRLQPDIVLLDIRMPGIDGIEVARQYREFEHQPAIIFTTAFGEHALAAFDVAAVSYLVKPIRQEKLLQALSRSEKLNQAQLSSIASTSNTPDCRSHISARVRGDIQLIPIDQIYYFYADQKYVSVFHKQGETLIEETLKDLEKEFSHIFIRVHRNALVVISQLAGLHKDANGHVFATLKHQEKMLEISRRHIASVRKLLKTL